MGYIEKILAFVPANTVPGPALRPRDHATSVNIMNTAGYHRALCWIIWNWGGKLAPGCSRLSLCRDGFRMTSQGFYYGHFLDRVFLGPPSPVSRNMDRGSQTWRRLVPEVLFL